MIVGLQRSRAGDSPRIDPDIVQWLVPGVATLGLAAVLAGAALPWLTLFRGLQAVPGFELDGGMLAGLAVAATAVLVYTTRRGGPTIAWIAAGAAGLLIAGDALLVAARIGTFVADPGPSGPLTQPGSGPGAIVMAAGGTLLAAAAVVGTVVGAVRRPAPLEGAPLEGAPREGAVAPWSALALPGALLVAGWIHVLLVPEHLGESSLLGMGFVAVGAAELVLAAVAFAGAIRGRQSAPEWVRLAVVIVVVASLAAYAYAVLVGLPFDPVEHASGLALGAGEPVDASGAIAKLSELAAIALAFRGAGAASRPRNA